MSKQCGPGSLPNLLSLRCFCSALAALLQHFGALHRALLSVSKLNAVVKTQFDAACMAIDGCAQLARRLALRRDDTVRLGSALALVFGAGPAFLQPHTSNTADPSKQFASLMLDSGHQLAAAAMTLQ